MRRSLVVLSLAEAALAEVLGQAALLAQLALGHAAGHIGAGVHDVDGHGRRLPRTRGRPLEASALTRHVRLTTDRAVVQGVEGRSAAWRRLDGRLGLPQLPLTQLEHLLPVSVHLLLEVLCQDLAPLLRLVDLLVCHDVL